MVLAPVPAGFIVTVATPALLVSAVAGVIVPTVASVAKLTIVFGTAHVLEDVLEQRKMLHLLIAKYFALMELGKDYRPVTDQELKRTAVYELRIESWSGKENWQEKADQSDDWPALDKKWSV